MAVSGKVLRGSGDADRLNGTAGDDVIFGFDGGNRSWSAGRIVVEKIGEGFDGAAFVGSAPGRPGEIYVLQKDSGEIRILDPETGDSTLFLDVPDEELGTAGAEEGMTGLVFHPDYASNGRFFVHLTNAHGDIEIREYARDGGPGNAADPEPVRTIMTIPHPDSAWHMGGSMVFGPDNGHLYIGIGDGGGTGAGAGANGQRTDNLLGTLLRIDVDGDDFPGNDGRNYAIPDDNPFVGAPGLDEIWAYGLRNPWRIAFDEEGNLFIADVGQSTREEVDFQPASDPGGNNYGWNLAEGTTGTPPPGAIDPIYDYGRDLGRSIIGGPVYQGAEESLQGAYLFGDFGNANFWTMRVEDGELAHLDLRADQIRTPDGPISLLTSYGVDSHGELLAVTVGGDVFGFRMTRGAGDVGDVLRGGRGSDEIYGGAGADKLVGGDQGDKLRGGFGDDNLFGGSGWDLLLGDTGADRLIGGRGRDRLKGGDDADQFVFRSTAESRVARPDVVIDFTVGEDLVNLSRIDADAGTGGDQAFSLTGRSGFSGEAGELRYGGGTLRGDVDGDGRADFAVSFRHAPGLDADAFIL